MPSPKRGQDLCEDGVEIAHVTVPAMKLFGDTEEAVSWAVLVRVISIIQAALKKKGVTCSGRCIDDADKECVVSIEPDPSDLIDPDLIMQWNMQTSKFDTRFMCRFPRTRFAISCECAERTSNA